MEGLRRAGDGFTWVGWSATIILVVVLGIPKAQAQLINTLVLPGDAVDLSGTSFNRLGYFSDLWYDATKNVYYALGDRGPGGGTIDYEPRVQQFSLDVDRRTGAISNFKLLKTIIFRQSDGKTPFSGLAPHKDAHRAGGADNSVLGRSLDSEGFVVAPNGHMFVSDEYGPSIEELDANGVLIRSIAPPANIEPRSADGKLTYSGSSKSKEVPPLVKGRQDNHGYEGLAISPDGTTLYAALQDPLEEEGSDRQGRNSRNLRIVQYSIATGASTAQYIYQLEPLAEINSRLPSNAHFGAGTQGRSIGVSAILCVGPAKLLVLERDNRGIGIDDPNGTTPVGSKRIYQIDLADATNAASISLAGSDALPTGVAPVQKSLLFDIQAALEAAHERTPEKMEGMAIGPRLADGSRLILIGTDNDFSVTQEPGKAQLDLYTDFIHQPLERDFGKPAHLHGSEVGTPPGYTLIPGYLYAFRLPP